MQQKTCTNVSQSGDPLIKKIKSIYPSKKKCCVKSESILVSGVPTKDTTNDVFHAFHSKKELINEKKNNGISDKFYHDYIKLNSGTIFSGMLKKNNDSIYIPHGPATLYLPDKTKVSMFWKDGVPININKYNMINNYFK